MMDWIGWFVWFPLSMVAVLTVGFLIIRWELRAIYRNLQEWGKELPSG